jgi:hypothetical protein
MNNAQQLANVVTLVHLIAEAVRTAKEVPSGTVYAAVCSSVTIDQYAAILGILKRTKLVEETPAHLLRWIGPVFEEASR